MKGSFELLVKQSLLMTSEMLFAIDMLGMNSVEIERLLDEELKNNPFLEENEHYFFNHGLSSISSSDPEVSPFLIALFKNAKDEDFREQLLRQVGEGHFNTIESKIAFMIIHNLDDDGLLVDAELVYCLIREKLNVFDEWIESVRLRIMELEPMGCGAKSINETLMFQMKRKCHYAHHEFLTVLDGIKKNPNQKLNQRFRKIIKNDERLSELKKLCARPASLGQTIKVDGVLPDIVVTKNVGTPLVNLLRTPSKRLVLNGRLKTLKKMKETLLTKSHKRAIFLLRSLKFRENSVLTVAKLVVEAQSDWFFYGGALKALHLRDIAQHAGLHESNVSRIVRGKYVACDRGIFELKYFFGGALKQNNGLDELSASFIKEKIRFVIDKENKTSPFSDQQIKGLLFSQGIRISRRTIAKYRGSLKIASACERRAWLPKNI